VNVKLLIKDFDSKDKEKDKWIELLSGLMRTYAGELGLSEDYIKDVIIADKDQFPEALKIHTDIRKYPNNDRYTKLVKTVLHQNEAGDIRACLVIRQELMEQILKAVSEEKKEWEYTELFYRYILHHELGHCLDYEKRFSADAWKDFDPDQFSVQQVSRYFGAILLEEFAACAHASKTMTSGIFHDEINAASDNAAKQMNELESIRENYKGKPEQLFDVAVSASSIFWMILIQYARLMGSKINNESLSKFRMKVWDRGGAKSGLILAKLGEELWELWKNYPDWKPDDYAFLLDMWYRMSMENGFRFVETPEGDGVYWE
jgi:hypothetical protein